MGAVCLQRYWLSGGCICFKRAGHANPLVDPLREIGAKWRELAIARRSARVLTNSRYMRTELLKVGLPPDTTDVLYYFTQSNTPAQPMGALDPATEAFLRTSDAPLLFTPARLTLPDKGVDFLLTALAGVERPFKAVIAGSGPAEAWLRQKARDDGVAARVHFTGWLGPGGIETLYGRADVVVCPSVWDEPFGLVGIEAMAHGKPVVAFDVGGIPEWLSDGETGYCLARKDVGGMARALERLLQDPGLATRFGERGRALVHQRFPRERHVDGLEAALAAAAGR
jgi:glycosyltransferase involved in cell wall biosynthesis